MGQPLDNWVYCRHGWAIRCSASQQGLRKLLFLDPQKEAPAAESRRFCDTTAHTFQILEAELDRYFDGQAIRFSVQLDWQGFSAFEIEVWTALREVPSGRVMTYGELAQKIGKPGAARAVGGALHRNPLPLVVPCHRIVSKSGIGGFAVGVEIKRALLQHEGVFFS
ncbi:methylated-DNA--[protein]-cysteine S-methyltransferase [candidate division KSB1 bacterium]|nr:methylated-DNA--[protein]-cysteine S-methyltransferase [candidate division KSB1 bacterium]